MITKTFSSNTWILFLAFLFLAATTKAQIVNPYGLVEAEDFDGQSGVQVVGNSNVAGVAYTNDGDFLRFDNVDFANGPISGGIRASSATNGGVIEFRTGAVDGPIVATANVTNTGGWRQPEIFPIEVVDPTGYAAGSEFLGTQTLYLVFTGAGSSLIALDKFRFNVAQVPVEEIQFLNCPTVPIAIGDQVDLEVDIVPDFPSTPEVTFSASTGITVDEATGVVTATEAGEFTVTATSLADGSISDQCQIIVSEELPPALVRINSGGPGISYGDTTFIADEYFGGNGNPYTNNNIGDIFGTDRDDIYKTERSTFASLQSFSYNIPLTNGDYTVNLHFAEIFFGATGGGAGGPDKRVFDVTLEGESVISNLDLNDAVGSMTALVETFPTTVSDESLDIVFTASVNQPKVSAIEVFGEGSLITNPGNCAWNTLASSSLSKVEAHSVKINDKLYVLAGFEAGLQITGATEIYDPATDSWTNGAPMPTPVTHMGAVGVDEEIWIIAGFVGNHPGVATDLVQVYNTVTDTWSSGPSLPNPRGSGAAAYSDGKIYFFGGLLPDRMTDVGEHYVLDVNDQAAGWQALTDMPEPRNHLSAAAVNGIIYAIGGQFGHDGGVDDQKFLHAYDPATGAWTQLADLPSDRSHFEPGTIVHNDKIIIVGGRRGGFFFDDVTEYDPATDTWSERCELPSALLAPAAKVFGDQLIVANGGEGGVCCPLDETISIAIEPEINEDFRVLIFHKTNGFRHGSINAGIDMIEEFGLENNWIVEDSQNSNIFTDANLSDVNVVVWLNTSGNNLLTGTEQDAFENYIQNGGGFVGFHAATDTYRNQSWPWYNDLVGAIVQTGPNHTSNNFNATMDVVGSHPAVDHLGTEWNKNEEYYYWELNGGYIFDGNIDLLRVRSTGSQSYDAPRPITWYKEYDGGRSFYTALGHNGSDYNNNDDFRIMSEQAILWAGGVIDIAPDNGLAEESAGSHDSHNHGIVAYPNPTNDLLNIRAEGEGIMEVTLLSITGKILKEVRGMSGLQLDLSDLNRGMYLLQVKQGEERSQLKIVKE